MNGVSVAGAVDLARLAYEAWRDAMPVKLHSRRARVDDGAGQSRVMTIRELKSFDFLPAVERNAWVEAVQTVLRASEDAKTKGAGA
jgi:hypothetical protein